jgi:hypothetical protein
MCLLQFVNFSARQVEFGTGEKLIFKNNYAHFGKNSEIHGKICVKQTSSTGNNCCGQRSVILGSEVSLSSDSLHTFLRPSVLRNLKLNSRQRKASQISFHNSISISFDIQYAFDVP